MKKIILITLIGLGLIISFFISKRLNSPTQIYPYPYLFSDYKVQDLKKAKEADVLLMGDRMAMALNPYLKRIIPDLSKNLNKPLNIFNWAQKHEGMHRALYKLKKLKKLPKIIIFHGASEEYFESKLNIKDYKNIMKNFKMIENDLFLSLLMIYREPSRFLFYPIKHKKLNSKIIKDEMMISDQNKQKMQELRFKMFEHEFLEFVEYIIDHGSTLIVVSTPLNYKVAPKKSCDFIESKKDKKIFEKIKTILSKGNSKTAFELLQKFISIYPTDPWAHYYFANASQDLGKKNLAKKHWGLALTFDCKLWRGNIVYNAIIEKHTRHYDAVYLDFHEMLQRNFGNNILFLNDLYPQNLFYQEIAEDIKNKISNILRLR